MKYITLILLILVSCSYDNDERKFWYPVALKEVYCGAFKIKVYQMLKSTSSRNFHIISHVDASDNRPVSIGDNCVVKTIETYPENYLNGKGQLTNFQRENVMEVIR